MKNLELTMHVIGNLVIILIVMAFLVLFFAGMNAIALDIALVCLGLFLIKMIIYYFYKKTRVMVYKVSMESYKFAAVRSLFHYIEEQLESEKIHRVRVERKIGNGYYNCIFVPKKDKEKAETIIKRTCKNQNVSEE